MDSPPPPAPFSSKLRVDKCILEYLTQNQPQVIKKLKESTITDDDIPNLEPHPSDYRMAYFAAEIYEDNCTIPHDRDWELLIKVSNASLGNGYVGAAFFNPLQQQIIIAHRGTNSLNAVWTDLKSIVWGSLSPQIYSALTFTDFIRDVIAKLRSEEKWRYQLSFTGHSLGGFLAQVTTFGAKYLRRYDGVFLKSADPGIHGHCVTFDNPGCAEMLNKISDDCDLRYLKTIFPSALDLTAYLSAPNKINMCHRHVGVLLRLKLSFEEMSFVSSKTPLYHVKTHNMEAIKSVFHPDEAEITVDVDQIFDWPNTIVYSNEEYKNFFKFSKKNQNFSPDINNNSTLVSVGEGRFNAIRYLSKKRSVNSCNVSLFSDDELFLLKHWLKIVHSPITIEEIFSPLNLPFRELFYRFERIRDVLIFSDRASMTDTIKRCKQICRWYPEEIRKCLNSLLFKSHEVIMQVAVDTYYNESFDNYCKVNFNDSIKLENFLKVDENNVLMIKPNIGNYEIEMLRLFNIFKQIRSKRGVNIDKYLGKYCFLFVNQSYLLTLFKYAELDLFIRSQLKLLIVDLLNEKVHDDVLTLIKGFARDDRKVVIVTGSKIDLISTSSREITTPAFTFTDLTTDSQTFALNSEIIKFHNEMYSLNTFLLNTIISTDNWTERSPFLNDYQFLDLLLNDRFIELKNVDSLNLSKLENFYIHADNDQNYSYEDFLQLIDDSDCDLNESKILITHVCDRLLNLKIPCDTLRTSDLDEAAQYFKERCDEESSRKFYWFHYDQNVSLKQIYNPDLYIPRSFYYEMILDETIKDELLMRRAQNRSKSNRVTVKLTKPDNRFLTCNFRIDRKSNKVTYVGVWDGNDNNNQISDVRDFLTISHDDSLAERELVNRRVVLITGDPGIGKSTTAMSLISKMGRSSCIFKLTYGDCTTIVKRLNDNFEVAQIAEQLLRIKSSTYKSDFLKYQLAHKTPIKVVFLFDEVFDSSHDDRHNEERILQFLRYLCNETESLVVITARETKREMIENALNIFSLQFKQFDRNDVEGYLTKYWSELFHFDLKLKRLTSLEGLDDYTKRLLDKAEEIFDRKILNFIGIPLQIKLLAEVAAPDCASLFGQSPDNRIPLLKLPDSLTGIFEAFVDKKLAIVCNKSHRGEFSSVEKGYLDFIDKKLRVFAAYKFRFYDRFKYEELLESLQQTGLVQGSEFIHQTIQEFYFARQLFAWLKKRKGRHGDKLPKLEEYLIGVFTSPEFSIVRMFLDTYISKITPRDVPFYSPKIVEILIKQYGISVLSCSKNKPIPLHTLILEHCQGTIIFLLESLKNHCDAATFLPLLIAMNRFDETVLCLACQSNQTLVIDYFVQFLGAQSEEMQNKIIITTFYRLPKKIFLNALDNFIARIPVSAISIKEITQLIRKDIDLIRDLTLAAQNGSLEIVRRCLITKVSDQLKPDLLDARLDYDRNNALHLAVKHDHPEIVRLLIEHGSNVNRENRDGMTPIALACETGNLEILRHLIENGGDYTKKDNRGVTPFHRAAARGHAVMVEYFLKELKYKEVNETDSIGDTALHRAVGNKQKRVVEILLKHDGIDVNAQNCHGMRALDYAINEEDLVLIKKIVKAGARIGYMDNYGVSPIERANRIGREDIVEYFNKNDFIVYISRINLKLVKFILFGMIITSIYMYITRMILYHQMFSKFSKFIVFCTFHLMFVLILDKKTNVFTKIK